MSKNTDIVDDSKSMFESRFAAGTMEKFPEAKVPLKFETNIVSSWSYVMEDHAKKYVEIYCEFANKTIEQLYKVATSCLDDHHFKEEENGSNGELFVVCPQIVLKSVFGSY